MNSFDIRIPYVEVRDKDRNIIGIVEGAEIFFEYAFNGSGEFEIYCRATQNNLALLQKDNFITIPVNTDSIEHLIEKNSNMWIIEKIHRSNSRTGGRWITASGREAKQIVDRRIIRIPQKLNGGESLVYQVKTKLFDKNMADGESVRIGGYLNGDKTSNIAAYELYPHSSGLITGDIFETGRGELGEIGEYSDDHGYYNAYVPYSGDVANSSGTFIYVRYPRSVRDFIFNNNVPDAGEYDSTITYQDSIMNIKIKEETQVFYENLFDFTEQLYLNHGVGAKLRLNRSNRDMLYEIYQGTRKEEEIVFSRGNENLINTDYTEEWSEYKNFAMVGGEGEEKIVTDPLTGFQTSRSTARTIVTVDNGFTDIDRREVFVDASDLQSSYEEEVNGVTKKYTYDKKTYKSILHSRGIEELTIENKFKIEFTGEIDVTNDRYKFNVDYYLGDIVKIRDDDFNIEVLVRVKKFIKVQNDEGYKEYFEYEKYEEVS